MIGGFTEDAGARYALRLLDAMKDNRTRNARQTVWKALGKVDSMITFLDGRLIVLNLVPRRLR
jgi:hypothetical protein